MTMRETAEAFILDYLKECPEGFDILHAEFVEEFITEVKCKFRATWWGAPKCKYLYTTLKRMTDAGVLKRTRCGLPHGNWQPGFPKWVFHYTMNPRYVYWRDKYGTASDQTGQSE